MKRFSNLKIMKKIYLAIFAICISFFAVTILGSSYNKKQLENEVIKNINSKNEFWLGQWNTQIDALLLEQSNLINDDSLKEINVFWNTMDKYDQISAVNLLSNRLIQIKLLNSIVSEARVCFLRHNIIVSSNKVLEKDTQIDLSKYQNRITVEDGNIYLTNYFPVLIYSGDGKAVSYIVQTELSQEKISRYFASMISEGDQLYLFDSGGEMLAKAGTSKEGQEISTEEMQTFLSKDGGGNLHISKNEFAYCVYSEVSDCYLLYVYPRLKLDEPLSFFIVYNIVALVLACFLLIFFLLIAYRILARPVNKIMNALENGDKDFYIVNDKKTDEFSYIYSAYNEMIIEMKHLMRQKLDMEYELRMAQLLQLQYQIQPHFLYNSIFTIFRMATLDENEEIAEYSKNLGQYYEYITKLNGNMVKVGEEIRYLKNYLYIQETRFGDRISVEMDEIPEEICDLEITPLILQPLVENSYKHGMKEMTSGGKIHISASYQDSVFKFCVEDNGKGMTGEELERIQEDFHQQITSVGVTHGLTNVYARIKRIYGEESSLVIENRHEGGARSLLRIRIVSAKK